MAQESCKWKNNNLVKEKIAHELKHFTLQITKYGATSQLTAGGTYSH